MDIESEPADIRNEWFAQTKRRAAEAAEEICTALRGIISRTDQAAFLAEKLVEWHGEPSANDIANVKAALAQWDVDFPPAAREKYRQYIRAGGEPLF